MLRLLPLCVLLLPSVGVAQSPWYVPDDFQTIQRGVDGAANGDTVIVRDGVYYDSVKFNGKEIHLKSENAFGASVSANFTESVFSFKHGEGPGAILTVTARSISTRPAAAVGC